MRGQYIKIKSLEDQAVIIDNDPQLRVKETEGNLPNGKIPVSFSINMESWKGWEKLCCRLRDRFH
jgi:hypothetical protein